MAAEPKDFAVRHEIRMHCTPQESDLIKLLREMRVTRCDCDILGGTLQVSFEVRSLAVSSGELAGAFLAVHKIA